MMDEMGLLPKKRFKRFKANESWQEIKLGENAIIKGRLGWKSLKREEYIDNGPSMIAGKHIKNGIIDWNEVDHIPLWRYEESPEIMLKNDDVIFSKDGSLGNPALITDLKGKATINSTMMLVRTNKNLNASFFYQILNSKQFLDLVYLKVSGSSIPHLFQEDMKNFKFYAPDVNEQQKIGEFFKILDKRIANQERKIAKVKSLKSAYLTEMFPQEGENVPRRRFNGFEGEWQEKSLKDFRDESDAYSYTGGPFGSDLKTDDYTKTGIRIIQLQNIGDGYFSNEYKIYTSKEKAASLSSNLIFPEDIIIAKMAEPLARAAIIPYHEEKYLMASDGIRLKVDKKKYDNYFILTLINHDDFRSKAIENSTGTTRKRIGLVTLGNLISYVPELEEQQKIGQFFKNLDDQIATEEKKLEKLKKKMKEAYLEEMFV